MEQKMFCYQCQETAGCKGCTMSGVCGKKPDVAAMQDLLVYVTKGISAITTALRQEGKRDLSQKEIAAILGMSQTGYSKYETGENDIPTQILIKRALNQESVLH